MCFVVAAPVTKLPTKMLLLSWAKNWYSLASFNSLFSPHTHTQLFSMGLNFSFIQVFVYMGKPNAIYSQKAQRISKVSFIWVLNPASLTPSGAIFKKSFFREIFVNLLSQNIHMLLNK